MPSGFAHGFQAMSDGVELIYCHSAAYVAEAEAGLHVLDPQLAISALAGAWLVATRSMSCIFTRQAILNKCLQMRY